MKLKTGDAIKSNRRLCAFASLREILNLLFSVFRKPIFSPAKKPGRGEDKHMECKNDLKPGEIPSRRFA
jgi:hypothetical protein